MRVHTGVQVGVVAPARTRLHFAGDMRAALDLLYWIHTYVEDVLLIEPKIGRRNERQISIGKNSIHLVGFEDDEALLPLATKMFPGFRLIEEYYTLPQKFSFLDVE